jgi:hypothetical protein
MAPISQNNHLIVRRAATRQINAMCNMPQE